MKGSVFDVVTKFYQSLWARQNHDEVFDLFSGDITFTVKYPPDHVNKSDKSLTAMTDRSIARTQTYEVMTDRSIARTQNYEVMSDKHLVGKEDVISFFKERVFQVILLDTTDILDFSLCHVSETQVNVHYEFDQEHTDLDGICHLVATDKFVLDEDGKICQIDATLEQCKPLDE